MSQKQSKTLQLVFSALMIAIGTVLSLFTFQGFWVYGGGVTFCSMLPLVIISYRYGWKWGVFTSFVYGLVQMVLGMQNVMYGPNWYTMLAIILLDYLIAFGVIGFSSVFKGRIKNESLALALGVILAMLLRFLCHFISGWFIWDALWPNEMGMTSAIYSLVYNGSYMLPEAIITCIAAVILDRILHFKTIGRH